MTKQEVRDRILEEKMIAIVRASTCDAAMTAARAICAGGIGIVEITMTVPGAIEAISTLSRSGGMNGSSTPGFSGMLIGAGTVLDAETANRCIDAGARFIVSPGLDAAVVEAAQSRNVLVIAGALTPTEVIAAWKSGADFVKIFPCGSVGGVGHLRALKAALPHIGMVPTGGVTVANAAEFLNAGAAAVGIGSELCSDSALASANFAGITEMARHFAAVALRESRT
jgi:2-dehydro-3-deoxyphosphogluconate aldolase/(4S)-4-hydroxy-2-oxoglutarate aldolase